MAENHTFDSCHQGDLKFSNSYSKVHPETQMSEREGEMQTIDHLIFQVVITFLFLVDACGKQVHT